MIDGLFFWCAHKSNSTILTKTSKKPLNTHFFGWINLQVFYEIIFKVDKFHITWKTINNFNFITTCISHLFDQPLLKISPSLFIMPRRILKVNSKFVQRLCCKTKFQGFLNIPKIILTRLFFFYLLHKGKITKSG